ncbi:hypothetical protein GCM10007916_14880 [Psychromonas marina]|uniref:Type II secretion system protein n=1 Tax=Psychromonas marina TaxID=88364 RepID=A0ABQ6E076_9GAMM|nr:hypothetical protein [Psychromonas marina]GLS90421.1 hypothetical protein GCM10007916_14880 [Psychromonas marina]
MKKRIEYPLFEYVVIIILLFVVAIFALPKFIDVGIEARIKALNATVLSISSVNRMLYSRALIKGVQENALQTTDILGEKDAGAYLIYGELRAQEKDLQRFLDSDLIEYAPTNKEGVIRLYLDRFKNDACYLDYQQAAQKMMPNGRVAIQKATYRVKSTGC